MELVIDRKNAKWLETLRTRLQDMMKDVIPSAADAAEEAEAESEGAACEQFAYRRTLLFYTQSCECCRYAKCVRDANGEKTWVCGCGSTGQSAC